MLSCGLSALQRIGSDALVGHNITARHFQNMPGLDTEMQETLRQIQDVLEERGMTAKRSILLAAPAQWTAEHQGRPGGHQLA
jgi:hypothetical protein